MIVSYLNHAFSYYFLFFMVSLDAFLLLYLCIFCLISSLNRFIDSVFPFSQRLFSQSPILPPHPGLVIFLVCCTAAILELPSLFSSICPLSPQPYSFISGTGRGYRTLTVAWLLTLVAIQLRALTTHISSQELA